MIYVLAGDYRQFQSFLHEFHLREDFGRACSGGGCQRGQVRYLSNYDTLRGRQNILVLTYGTWKERKDALEIEDYCQVVDIPFMPVPDLKRQRYVRERAAQRPLNKGW